VSGSKPLSLYSIEKRAEEMEKDRTSSNDVIRYALGVGKFVAERLASTMRPKSSGVGT
jgi:hypothetical protein